MTKQRLRWAFITWDGVLPLVIAAIPYFVKLLLGRNDAAEILVAIFVPIAAALIRTNLGARQIRIICDGELPAWRQVMLGAAIASMMLFEGIVAMLIFANDESPSAWLYPLFFYLCYLAASIVALLPRASDHFPD